LKKHKRLLEAGPRYANVQCPHIRQRVELALDRTPSEVCGSEFISVKHNRKVSYLASDLKYDLERGFLRLNEHTGYVPRPGDFLLFTGLPRPEKPFYLVKVTSYNAKTEDVEFQYLNSASNKQKYRYVWLKQTPDGTSTLERNNQPKGFTASLQFANRDDFCWTPVRPQANADGSLRLLLSEVKRAMAHKHKPGK
jgi:hypothetical protein